MRIRIVVGALALSLAMLSAFCVVQTPKTLVAEEPKQDQAPHQPKESRTPGPASVVDDLADSRQLLAKLRPKFPGKSDDEIVRVLRGYCGGGEASSDGMKWFTERLKQAHKQEQARELIRKSGGYTRCERDRFIDLPMSQIKEPSQPGWLRKLVGEDFFDPVVVCDFYGPETGDSALAPLEELPQLDWLSVSGRRNDYSPPARTQVTDAGLEHLKKLVHLRSLYLEGSRITDSGLATVEGLSELESVSLGNTSITDAGLKHFQHLSRLRDLYVGDTRITGSGLEHLRALTHLEHLDLRNCPLVAANLKWLQSFPLHELDLDGCRAVDDSVLPHLRLMSELCELRLEETAITDAGLEHLKGLSGLEWLLLSKTKITDKGLEHLQGLTRLESLGLDECAVTDAGLQHVEGLRRLKSLYLNKTKVTDAGLAHLRGLNQLWELTLNDCHITDAALEQLRSLANLKHLHVERTMVTERGVKRLNQALPDCYIDH